MSVFTPLNADQIQQLLAAQQLTLLHFSPASEGIENSNFFVTTDNAQGMEQEWVLTLLEQLDMTQAIWFQALLTRLENEDLPVAVPQGDLQQFAGKPVLLAPRLVGRHPARPTPSQVHAIGQVLARLHDCGFALPSPVPDERARLVELTQQLPLLPANWRARASRLLADWQAVTGEKRLIHGDLFRDNALFEGDRLTGLLDFYNASYELPVYDLAVALNDWALDEQGEADAQLEQALLSGYAQVAPLPTPELLPQALAVAALRFWLSRLASQRRASAGRGSKSPAEFAAKTALRWVGLTR